MTVTYLDEESRSVAVVRRTDYGWWLDTIRVPRRNRQMGHGSRLLDAVCRDADVLGVTLRLAPQPEPGGLVYGELVRWYGKRGFLDIGDGLMERPWRGRRGAWESAGMKTSSSRSAV